MAYTPNPYDYRERRQSPRWLAFLFPIALFAALCRLLARSLARAILVLPRELVRRERFIRSLLWLIGAWVLMRVLLLHHAPFRERIFTLNWYWDIGQAGFVFPRLLNDFWHRTLRGYQDEHLLSVIKPWLLLIMVWAAGLHVIFSVVYALRIGFSPDGEKPLSWPRPRRRAPLPGGFVVSSLGMVVRLIPVFLVVALLPPWIRTFWASWDVKNPIRLAIPLWHSLLWFRIPRLLDPTVQDLLVQDPQWTTRRWLMSPQEHVPTPTLAFLGIELGVIAIIVTSLLTVGWLLDTWSAASGERSSPWVSAGSHFQSPRWALVMLPITLPIALVSTVIWKIPRWLPWMILVPGIIYLLFFVMFYLVILIMVIRHDSTHWESMHYLRHWWSLAEAKFVFPSHWHRQFRLIPHARTDHIGNGDIAQAILMLSLVGAAVAVPVSIGVCFVGVGVQRVLKVVAR